MFAPSTTSASLPHAWRNSASVVTGVAADAAVDAVRATTPPPSNPSSATNGAANRPRQVRDVITASAGDKVRRSIDLFGPNASDPHTRELRRARPVAEAFRAESSWAHALAPVWLASDSMRARPIAHRSRWSPRVFHIR